MANLPDRVAALESALADLAEIVGYGRAGHVSSPGENPALKIAAQFRPQPEGGMPAVEGPVSLCAKKRKPDQDEDGEVCLLNADHPGGHMFGPAPKAVAAQAP